MKCPQCSGEIWDNQAENDKRELNGEKLRPDYACKDKENCGWVMWRVKEKKKILVETNPKPIQKTPTKDEFVEGKKENNRLICRTNLMCEVTRAYAQMGSINLFEIKGTFNDLWEATDK